MTRIETTIFEGGTPADLAECLTRLETSGNSGKIGFVVTSNRSVPLDNGKAGTGAAAMVRVVEVLA